MSLTLAGRQAFLGRLLRDETLVLHAGICAVVPSDSTSLTDISEPAIGTNGYARIALTIGTTDFPSTGLINGEPYVDSRGLVFEATGGDFSEAITRVFLTPEATATTGEVYALSTALPAERIITPATLLVDRTFTFRLILR